MIEFLAAVLVGLVVSAVVLAVCGGAAALLCAALRAMREAE